MAYLKGLYKSLLTLFWNLSYYKGKAKKGMIVVKKSFRIVILLFVCLLIGSATNAFAAIGEVVEAQFAKFNFVVNGTEKTIDCDPLVYQGTTYLPVRCFSNMLGLDVTYKADTRTIEINTPAPSAKEVNKSVSDFRIHSPEIIAGQLKALEASLLIEKDPEIISKIETGIAERKAYLEQIDWVDDRNSEKSEVEKQINALNVQIEGMKHMLEIEKGNKDQNEGLIQRLESIIEELNLKKAVLEAQLEVLKAQLTE